jgi:hypothetical protein
MDRTTNLTIGISVTTAADRGPNLRVYVNQKLVQSLDNLQQDITVTLDLNDLRPVNLIFVEHHGKDPTQISQGDIAAEIRSVTIGGLPLPRNLLFDQIFYPNWQWGGAANFLTQNCYLGFNGVWQLAFPQDHRQWILDYLEQELFPRPVEIPIIPLKLQD